MIESMYDAFGNKLLSEVDNGCYKQGFKFAFSIIHVELQTSDKGYNSSNDYILVKSNRDSFTVDQAELIDNTTNDLQKSSKKCELMEIRAYFNGENQHIMLISVCS